MSFTDINFLFQVNKTPLQPADPVRPIHICPEFTPLYLGTFGSRSMGGPRGLVSDCSFSLSVTRNKNHCSHFHHHNFEAIENGDIYQDIFPPSPAAI